MSTDVGVQVSSLAPSSSQASYRLRRLFYALHQKPSRAHSAASPLRIKPACGWASIRFFAVSSRLSGLFQLGNFFIFPLMTNAVFTQRCGLEPRQSHFMRSLRCGKHTCRMKALRFSKNKYHKNPSAGLLVS